MGGAGQDRLGLSARRSRLTFDARRVLAMVEWHTTPETLSVRVETGHLPRGLHTLHRERVLGRNVGVTRGVASST